jgi:hypothetical protein
VGNGRYLLRFESLSKTNVGPIYVTAHNGWSGLLVTGSDSNGPGLVVNGARFEGYGAFSTTPHTAHSHHSFFRVSCGVSKNTE